MGDLSIEQIKLKANQARDLFEAYIDNLVNAGESRKASDKEIELFNLEDKYSNNQLSAAEATQIKSAIRDIDFEYLINMRAINYIQNEGRFSATGGVGDVNNDGQQDLKDLGALNYVLNYKGDPADTLEEILSIAGNQDKITEYYINKWAFERGLESGTTEYEAFYNKFYNQIYNNSQPKVEIGFLQNILRVYDIGLGKENIDEIDKYLPLFNSDVSMKNIISFYRFQNTNLFDVPEEQKSVKIDEYIALLSGPGSEKKKMFLEAFIRQRVPISGEELKVSNLDRMLAIAGNQIEITRFMINKWADLRNLEGNEKDEFYNKFFVDFYRSGDSNGLKMEHLKPLLDLYDEYRKAPGDDFDINKLDIYAEGYHKGLFTKTLALIHKFEKSSEFNLTGVERINTLNQYFNVLTNGSQEVQSYFLQALRYNQIPFSKEPLTVENLNSFLEKISTAEGILDLTFETWAKERNLINESNDQSDEFDLFINKLKQFHSRGLNVGQIKNLLTFFDKGKMLVSDIAKLDVYATGMLQGIKASSLMDMFKFENSLNFDIPEDQRSDQLRAYLNILKDGTDREKEILQKSLSSGEKVFLTGDELSVENINKALEEIRKPNGYEFLQFENFANERKLLSAEREVFITKLKQWLLPQESPNVNYQIKMGDISNLLSIYKDGKLELDDLDIYAKAIRDKVSFKALGILYKFETGVTFGSQAGNRETRLSNYIDILKSDKKEKITQMLNAMRYGKLPVTNDDMDLNKLEEILAKFDNRDELTELYIDTWSKNKENSTRFKDKFMTYYQDPNFNLSPGELTSLKSLYETNPSFDLDNLDAYALALKGKVSFNLLSKLFKLQGNTSFNGTNEQVNNYIRIIKSGTKNELYVLSQALINNNIPYIDKKFVTESSINLTQLDEVLEFVQDETKLSRLVISNWAKGMGIEENTIEYVDFMNKFYQEYLIDSGIKMGNLKVLQFIFSSREYSYERIDRMASALKQGLPSGDLTKLETIAKKNNLTEEEFNRYLDLLLGKEGEAKRKVISDMIRSNYIPFSGIKI